MAVTRGPITGGTRGWGFGSSTANLADRGYVEEEFFVDGEAAIYSLGGSQYSFDGRWDIHARGKVPFRTRLLARRPANPAGFNGVTIVDWGNVSRGNEFLGFLGDEVYAAGSAWVGASVQRIGIHGSPLHGTQGLEGWDNRRYGQLSIPDDDASFDIFTQIAEAVGPARDPSGPDPMGGLPVRHLIAHGASQSASRIATYYNAVQPVSQTFDGFLFSVYSGGGARLDALGPGPSNPDIPEEIRAVVNLLPFGSHRLRDDVRAVALVLNSETEAMWHYPARQPDTERYRLWEVAGAAHRGVICDDEDLISQSLRDTGVSPREVTSKITPTKSNPNTLRFSAVTDAALHHLVNWVKDGVLPPTQDRIEFVGDPGEIVRDQHGNAKGGVRLPELEVPTCTHVGSPPPGSVDLSGSSSPFPAQKLRALYHDRAAFAALNRAAVVAGVERGYFLERDVDRLCAGVDTPASL